MIDAALLRRLTADTPLTTKLGGKKVYIGKAPTPQKDDAPIQMPYIILSKVPQGDRKKITQKFTEETGMFYVRIFDTDEVRALNIGQLVYACLENFRGDLDGALDAHLTCRPSFPDRAVGGMYMVVIPVNFRYKWVTSYPSA